MIKKPMDNLIWIDLEMTGLDPDNDQIIEVAVAVTDHHLSEIIEVRILWLDSLKS